MRLKSFLKNLLRKDNTIKAATDSQIYVVNSGASGVSKLCLPSARRGFFVLINSD